MDITIYNNNLNGFNGKRASIQDLVDIVKPTVATFQETAVAGGNKINLKNYYCFQRNRKGVKQMGGVATFVSNEVKTNTLKVKEGEEKEEYLITRLDHVRPPVNIINVYGGQESRMTKEEILESWSQLRREIKDIEEREEGLVCIGDFNRAVGNDTLGVAENHPQVSFGGELIRELLEDDRYILLNNSKVTEGGPWTWESRLDQSIKSCLDLCIMSANLVPYTTKMLVDSRLKFYPKKVMMNRGRTKIIRSDHYPIIIQMEGMQRVNMKMPKESRWNLNKPGGWEKYKVTLEEASEKIDTIIDDETLSIEDVMRKVDSKMNNAKFYAFGKTKPITRKASERRLEVRLAAAQGLDGDQKVRDLMRKQFEQLEEEIVKLKDNKYGRVTNVFKMREIVAGPKKAPQEAHAVIDNEKKELVVSTEGIKKVTLQHCMDTLKDNKPEEDVEQLVTVIKDVHEHRMNEDDGNETEVTKDEFDLILDKFKRKNKRSYDFLMKAGNCFKNSIFKLCARMIKEETFPERFYETTLQQLWKRKFPRENLSNHRFIHLKDWLPKTCESLIVSQMKTQILKAGTKYQIGGVPGPGALGTEFSCFFRICRT